MIRFGLMLTSLVMATACQAESTQPAQAVQTPTVKTADLQTHDSNKSGDGALTVDGRAAIAPATAQASGSQFSASGAPSTPPSTPPAMPPAMPTPYELNCEGIAQQGGAMLCSTSPYAKVNIGRSDTKADAAGRVIIGFDRDAKPLTKVTLTHSDGHISKHTLPIKARTYVEQRIDGLPPSQVSEYSEQALKHIRASSARKKIGFASQQETLYFTDGFDYPVRDFVKTSPFGSRRILNGTPKKPHYGVDIAAPLGTPIYAPADGVVALADKDLYFEGAMVMLDHGQGLTSLYLHVNDIFVQPGDTVKRGDKIATVGSKGRSTGPHLCWRLKWRKENLDPELLTQWPK